MYKIIKRTIISTLVLATGLLFALPAATPVFADQSASKSAVCEGIGVTDGSGGCSDSGGSLDDAIKLAINILSLVAGIAAVIMIIVGGLKYITSNGDAGNAASAKNTILYAIIGLVVVALAQIIVRFVLDKV